MKEILGNEGKSKAEAIFDFVEKSVNITLEKCNLDNLKLGKNEELENKLVFKKYEDFNKGISEKLRVKI